MTFADENQKKRSEARMKKGGIIDGASVTKIPDHAIEYEQTNEKEKLGSSENTENQNSNRPYILGESLTVGENEEIYAEQLTTDRERYQTEQQLIDFHDQGVKYGHPSYVKYTIVSLLGLITESTDFLDLIGIGILVSKPISLLLTFIIFLIFWLTNTKQTNANNYAKKAEEVIKTVAANLAHLERRSYQAAKSARRLRAGRLAARIRISPRFVKSNPLFKFTAAAVANLIPFLAVFPWVLLGIYLSYRDEKKSYQNATETATEIARQIPELQNI